MTQTLTTDVLIIGGGLSGLALAGVLGESGVNVVCVDHAPPVTQLSDHYDARCTALSWATHKVLEAAGAWQSIAPHAEPMHDIRVADGDAPLFLHFAANADGNGEPFGWNLENQVLRKCLFDNIRRLEKYVTHLAPVEITAFFHDKNSAGCTLKDGRRISASLMIGADGRNSAVRAWLGIKTHTTDYKQRAIVCNIAHEKHHENVAVEHFLPAGPFALIPLTDDKNGTHRSSVIWTVEEQDAEKITALPAGKFDAALQDLCGPHLGKVRHVSPPRSYPLSLMHADTYTAPRVALMAEAAHVIHPIAGQGLNLGMRDVALLGTLVTQHLRTGLDIGSMILLNEYENTRRTDTRLMAGFTDILNRLFSNHMQTVKAVRVLGLGLVQKSAVLKAFFARQAMGDGGMKAPARRKKHS